MSSSVIYFLWAIWKLAMPRTERLHIFLSCWNILVEQQTLLPWLQKKQKETPKNGPYYGLYNESKTNMLLAPGDMENKN